MKNRSAIYLLLLANTITGVAQGVAMLAVPWYFTGIIHRSALFGKIYFTVTCISLVWGMYAGALIDRYDRRKIFLFTNLFGFAVSSIVSLVGFVADGLHWAWPALVFASTAFIYNIHFPNLYAYAQEITDKHDYARVTSLLEIQGQIAFTISGGLAALLLHGYRGEMHLPLTRYPIEIYLPAWKIHEIFSLGIAAYMITLVLIWRIRALPAGERKTDTGRLRHRLAAGIGYLRSHVAMLHFGNASLLVFLTILVFGTYVSTLYVNDYLRMGGDVYALSDMAFSAGALLAGIITTRIFKEKDAVRGIIALSALSGIMYLTMLTHHSARMFYAANFVIGSCNASIRIQRVTYMFHHVPNHIIGRTGSIFFMLNVFLRLCLIGFLSQPFFHRDTNVVYAVCIMAVICFAGALILWWIREEL
ncbi:MAG: MFS transporter [Chitinophagales bacterium]|nr:MFS transporter [Chitinophagales bacterium]MDW8418756.1 MFS transporter [Chitinophagales bacterium]